MVMIRTKFLKIFQPYFCEDIIRLGKDNDGGYLVNKQDILKSKKLLSLGVGDDVSFESDFMKLNNCPIVAYDGTIKPNQDFLNDFYKDDKTFINKNIGDKEGEVPFKSILGEQDVFLKCDIEEHEYAILNDIIIHSKQFTGITMEFHNINGEDHFNELLNFISKVELKLVHIHVNNWFYYKTEQGCIPDVIELTFTSSDNVVLDDNIKLPHKLDMSNRPGGEDFKITFK
jgi:hypothetical protein